MPVRTALTFALPFFIVAALVPLLEPTPGATILFFIAAVFAATMLAMLGDLSKAGPGAPFGERRQLLALALGQKRPFAACIDCLSLIDVGGANCGYCGSRRGLTYVIDRRNADRVKAMMTKQLH